MNTSERDVRLNVVPGLSEGLLNSSLHAASPFEIPPQRELIYPEGKVPIVKSLDIYAASLNDCGFDETIRQFTRVGKFMRSQMPEGSEFTVGAFGWCNKICGDESKCPFGCNMMRTSHEDAVNYIDGDYGLSFGVSCPDLDSPMWCAVTSFAFGGRLDIATDSAEAGESLPDLAPVIVQFQGSNFSERVYPELSRRSKGILGRTPWEFILGNLTINWWRNVSSDPIYMLPPEQNQHLQRSNFAERTFTKLNSVADDLGFVKDPSSGLYILE